MHGVVGILLSKIVMMATFGTSHTRFVLLLHVGVSRTFFEGGIASCPIYPIDHLIDFEPAVTPQQLTTGVAADLGIF
jgi:hypothetical protein